MASTPVMATTPMSSFPPRKSFAQVAAAANKPLIKTNVQHNKSASANEQGKGVESKPSIATRPTPNGTPRVVTPREVLASKSLEQQDAVDFLSPALAVTHFDDRSTSASNSEGLKKDNSDTKSVTSRTTLTLDEKESLRPDDSASMQAAVEEDVRSISGVTANSKQDSDPDAEAFRDQLRQIGISGDPRVIMPRTQRPERLSISGQPPTGPAFQPLQPVADFTPPQQAEIIRPRVTDPQMWINPPDEKLLEALASPKDRLFVLKVEQDLIDFIKDPREEFLQLPGTNSFYRMLSHKLADYYMLGHIVDDSMSSVRIFRTANARLPPPLIGSTPGTNGSTPPPSAPARKIMRRNAGGRHADRVATGDATFDSLTSSKATSDIGSGGENGIDGKDGRPVSKGKLTREERESRYNEARARIFKGFEAKEGVQKDTASAAIDNGLSRSSSTSGVKKNNNQRKQKKPKDDGFEARSAFDSLGRRISENAYIQSPPETPAYGQYYVDYNGQMQPGMMQKYMQMPEYGISSPTMQDMSGYPVPGQQSVSPPGSQGSHFGMMSPTYGQDPYSGMNGGYEGSQYSSPTAQDRTPKGTAPTLSGYNHEFMQQQQNWSSNGYYNAYGMNNYQQYPEYSNTGYAPYYNGQMMQQQQQQQQQPMSPGGHNGFSPQPAMTNYNPQAFFGNGYNDQNFNPQSQAFVPNMADQLPQYQQQLSSGFMPNSAGQPIPYQQSNNNNVRQTQQSGAGNSRSRSTTAKQQAPSITKWPTPANLPAKPPQSAVGSAPQAQLPQRPPTEERQFSSPRPIPTL